VSSGTGEGVESRVVYRRANLPLLILRTARLSLAEATLSAAAAELFDRPTAIRTTGFSATYLLGIEEDRARFPASTALVGRLRESIVRPLEAELGVAFGLSFLKLACGRPPSAPHGVYYEGPHLDSHPGIAPGTELLRVLINLGSYRRRFQYFQTDVYALQAAGVPVGRTDFAPLALPDDIARATLDIPGRTADRVDLLQFWASVVPHVGINESAGSFLASFEALAALPRASERGFVRPAFEERADARLLSLDAAPLRADAQKYQDPT
jgi:hypothetical protein